MLRAVLTTDVRFEGWTTESWTRFLSLWRPRAEPEREASRPRGGVIVIHDGQRVRKALHTHTGRISPEMAFPPNLAELAGVHRASFAVSLEMGALEEIMDDFGARLRKEDDLLAQALKLLASGREAMQTGKLELWPRRLAGVPVPTEGMVVRAMDALFSHGRVLLLGLFEDGALWTALCLRRRGTEIDLIAGPEDLKHTVGLLSGDHRRDYVHLTRAAEEMYGPLSFGCFSDVSTFRALQVDPEPGAWARAAAVRDIVLSPVPAGVGLALGFDGARLVASNLRIVTERIDRFGLLDGALRMARKQASKALEEKDVSAVLGFDPLAVLRALLRR